MRALSGVPTPAFNKVVAANVLPPLQATYSGEITGTTLGLPLGAVRTGGKISDVWLSVLGSGKDDTNTLSITTDVYINGTTCLSTAPVIAHVSGEAATTKTTKVTGDTGVTQSVMDCDANTCSPGDVLTYDFTLTRTASPTTEMNNVVLVVEFEPSK